MSQCIKGYLLTSVHVLKCSIRDDMAICKAHFSCAARIMFSCLSHLVLISLRHCGCQRTASLLSSRVSIICISLELVKKSKAYPLSSKLLQYMFHVIDILYISHHNPLSLGNVRRRTWPTVFYSTKNTRRCVELFDGVAW